MASKLAAAAICIALATVAPVVSADVFNMGSGYVSLETVHVGDSGNPHDPVDYDLVPGGRVYYGSVGYGYNIGKFEVTAGQYCEFLNAVVAVDTYDLYNEKMETSYASCGITRSTSVGGYRYSVDPNYINRPVTSVSWGDAARFCNWLHNGQPSGAQDLSTTEDGSYFLNGKTDDAGLGSVERKPDATWALPTFHEWFKAGYYSRTGDRYYKYPTGTDDPPSNVLESPDRGNNATYYDIKNYSYPEQEGYTIGKPFYFTEVGAHENSPSPYGTFDQGGNAQEWTEAISVSDTDVYCCKVGGDFSNDVYNLYAGPTYYVTSSYEGNYLGFRVVRVPEPGAMLLLVFGGVAAMVFTRRRRATR